MNIEGLGTRLTKKLEKKIKYFAVRGYGCSIDFSFLKDQIKKRGWTKDVIEYHETPSEFYGHFSVPSWNEIALLTNRKVEKAWAWTTYYDGYLFVTNDDEKYLLNGIVNHTYGRHDFTDEHSYSIVDNRLTLCGGGPKTFFGKVYDSGFLDQQLDKNKTEMLIGTSLKEVHEFLDKTIKFEQIGLISRKRIQKA